MIEPVSRGLVGEEQTETATRIAQEVSSTPAHRRAAGSSSGLAVPQVQAGHSVLETTVLS